MFGARVALFARHIPDDLCLLSGEERLTWSMLNARANRVANGLRSLGVRRGTKVAFLFRNSPEFIETNLGIQKLGAVSVPLNYRFVAGEIEYIVNNSDSEVILLDREFLPEVQRALPNLKGVRHVVCQGESVNRGPEYAAWRDSHSPREPRVKVPESDVAALLYTGGTTGMPKGVVLTYSHFLKDMDMATRALDAFLPPWGKSRSGEFDRRLAFGLSTRLAEMVKALQKPEFQGTPLVIDQAHSVISLVAREGRLHAYRGEPPGPHFRMSVRGNVPIEMGRLLAYIWSKRPFARLHVIAMALRKKVRVTRNTIPFLKAVRAISEGGRTEHKTILGPPLFHGGGYSFMCTWIIAGGGALLLLSKSRFDPQEVVDILRREKPAIIFLVPTMWKRLLQHPPLRELDLSGIATCVSGAALLPGDIKKQMLQVFPNAIVADVMGQTEMSPAVSMNIDGDADLVRERCIGPGLPGVEIRIVDEQGRDVPSGQPGELIYKAETIMAGYYKDEEKTKKAIRDGWFHSGDLARRDEEGLIYVLERTGECINSGAEKIYPLEVEELLAKHPAVEEVCVIGVPDPEWGEAVRAVIQPKPGATVTEQEILEWCKGKMAGYKKPKSVRFAEQLPITPVGKVQRAKVKEMFRQ